MNVKGRTYKTNRYSVEDRGYCTPCWVWLLRVNEDGYGVMGLPGSKKTVKSHSFFYKWTKGKVPPGKEIDHLCGVRSCCNPSHLEAVHHPENVRRGKNTILTEDQIVQIRLRLKGKEKSHEIARDFGISSTLVRQIKCGSAHRAKQD